MHYIVATLFGAYALVCLYLYVRQAGMVFAPSHEMTATPAEAGLTYEDLTLRAADGVELNAWFVPGPPGSTRVALFCHGNGGNISNRLETLSLLRELGLGTLLFDYRGYGRSDGRPSEAGVYLDAQAAWNHLRDRDIPAWDVVVWGRSLGGGVASWLASTHEAGALILESTFTSVPDLGARRYPFLPIRLLARHFFPTLDRLSSVHCPVLVVHSREDRVVPYAMGRRLYEAAREPKAFLDIQGRHFDGFLQSREAYVRGLRTFLAGLGPGGAYHRTATRR